MCVAMIPNLEGESSMKFRRSMRNLLFAGFGLIILLLCLVTSVAIATIFTLRDSDAVVYQQLTQAELARSLQYEIVAANHARDDALAGSSSHLDKDSLQRYQSDILMIVHIEKSLTSLPLTQTGVVTLAIFDNQWADYLKHNTLVFEIFQHGNETMALEVKTSPDAVLDTLEDFVGQTVATSATARTNAMHLSATSPTTMMFISILALLLGSGFIWFLAQGINRITDRLATSLEEVRFHHDALEKANGRLQQLATSDPLTQLPNHRTLIALLDQTLEQADSTASPCSFLFLDFDHFKAINDQYGHPAGDAILCELALVIRSAIRESDLLGRWGGEEFGVVLPETDHVQALLIGERIRSTIAAHLFATGGGIHMTCSIGLASYQQDALQRDELIEVADQAMYAAKHLGRNRVCTRQDLVNTSSQQLLKKSSEEKPLIEVAETLSCTIAAHDYDTELHTEAVDHSEAERIMGLTSERETSIP
jgi:diguanylate cyclase (GGDEF)-like protein